MKIVYILTLCAMLLMMNLLIMRAWKTKSPMVRVTNYLIIAVNIAVVSSMLASFLPVQNFALFMQCIHYISTEWVLIALLRFMEEYTKGDFARSWTRIIFYILTVASNCSLLLNCVLHHVVTSQYVDIGNGVMCFSYTNLSPWYQIHLYYCFLLALCNVSALVDKAVHTASFYRKKYIIPLIMVVLTVLADRICSIMNYPLDYSLLIYIILAIFLTYYSIFFTPKELITNTLAYVVRDSRSGVVCFDVEGKCIYANEEAMKIYGNPSDFSAMEDIFHRETGGIAFTDMEEKVWDTTLTVDARKLYYQISFNRLYDRKQSYIGCFFSLYDKTEDVERYVKERYQATHDSLTRLYNKDYFFESVLRVLKACPDRAYHMIYIDIKDFKLVNDLFGFETGNQILIQMATQIQERFPREAVCGRIESDHFAICIPQNLYTEKLLLSCINQVTDSMKDREYQLKIHAGVYAIQPEDNDISVMCDRANMAISTVKNDYDCTISYYDTKLMDKVMREKYLLGEFDSALTNHQFVMYLQPQVAPDGTPLGAEALVRWQHPEWGMIPPGEFIEVFEKAGLIHRLDRYIWDLAARKLSEWKQTGHEHLHISVNISVKDFFYLDLYKVFTDLAEKYDISPQKLKLEITETALMMEQDKILTLLDKLQHYGFCVEIDDFGSGYSSLNMLKDIHADVLKIDMGFLQETQNHERTKIILGTVVDLAKQLQMTVITEGVENKAQVDYLMAAGCDMFQGFYFDKPIAVEDFEEKYLSD